MESHGSSPSSHPITLDTGRLRQCHGDSFYLDLVVFPLLRDRDAPPPCPSHFFVECVEEELTVSSSPMPGLATSYREHLLEHGRSLTDPLQPMLRIASAKRPDLMLQEGGEPVADGKARSYHSYRAPELLGVEPLSAGLWRQAQALPWLLHRVEGLLHALPLAGPHWQHAPALQEEEQGSPAVSAEELMARLVSCHCPSGGAPSPGPSPGHLVHSITLAAAGDRWDMERQEILGDAFLKFSVGLFFHYKMTNDVTSSEFSGRSYDEGDLSSGRARVVSNRNLFKVAELLQLGQGAIRSLHVDPQTTWLPPGYSTGLQEEALLRLEARMAREHGWAVGDSVARVAREEMVLLGEAEEEEQLVKKLLERSEAKECVAGVLRLRSQRLLSDKSLADCVEASIGCHLLWGGPMSALHFMARSGVNLSSDNSTADLFSRQQSEDPVLPFSPQV